MSLIDWLDQAYRTEPRGKEWITAREYAIAKNLPYSTASYRLERAVREGIAVCRTFREVLPSGKLHLVKAYAMRDHDTGRNP